MIPATIHHLWFGPPMPELFESWRQRWADLNPGSELRLWTDDDDWSWLANRDLFDQADELFPRFAGQFRSDVARIEVLHAFGGVYADADLEPRLGLAHAIDVDVDCFAAWEDDGRWVNNAIMGATPGHPFLADLISGLPASVAARGPGDRPNRVSGPQYVTPIYRRQPRGTVTVFPSRLFYPYAYNELERGGDAFPGAVTIHHWNNQRRLRGRPLEQHP